MKHTKFVLAAAVAAVLGLVGSACSSGDGDSSPAETTAVAVATSGASVPPETAIATTEAAGNVAEEQSLPSTSEAETATAATASAAASSTTTTNASSVPSEASETPNTTTTSATTTTTTTASVAPQTTTTTSTTTSVPSVTDLRVQVLNGSGIPGAAGRLTARLEEAGWDMLPAGNAPRRYSASAVYYSHDVLEDQAAEIAVDTGVGGVVSLAMPSPAPFVVEGAGVYVVVLIGADDLGGSLRPPARASSLRPRQDNNIQLPLPPSTPRDRYVPGLAAANPYTEANENNPASAGQLADLASFLKEIGDCSKHQLGTPQPEKCQKQAPPKPLVSSRRRPARRPGVHTPECLRSPAGIFIHQPAPAHKRTRPGMELSHRSRHSHNRQTRRTPRRTPHKPGRKPVFLHPPSSPNNTRRTQAPRTPRSNRNTATHTLPSMASTIRRNPRIRQRSLVRPPHARHTTTRKPDVAGRISHEIHI